MLDEENPDCIYRRTLEDFRSPVGAQTIQVFNAASGANITQAQIAPGLFLLRRGLGYVAWLYGVGELPVTSSMMEYRCEENALKELDRRDAEARAELKAKGWMD